jgi:hypothetical protein
MPNGEGGVFLDTQFSIRVTDLTPGEVMQAMRRMMWKPYIILWLAAYIIVGIVALVRGNLSVYTLAGPAVILLLLALAYEFSGRKNFKPMQYADAMLDYDFTAQGYRLTVGEKSVEFSWETAKLVRTRSDFLLYSDKNNSSILPKRCLTTEEQQQLLSWAKGGKNP